MKKFAVGAAAVSAAVLVFGGTAWAAPKAPKGPKAAKPNETIVITLDAASPGGPAPVTAAGVFNGTGTDTRTARLAGTTNHGKDVLTFAGGTVTLRETNSIASQTATSPA